LTIELESINPSGTVLALYEMYAAVDSHARESGISEQRDSRGSGIGLPWANVRVYTRLGAFEAIFAAILCSGCRGGSSIGPPATTRAGLHPERRAFFDHSAAGNNGAIGCPSAAFPVPQGQCASRCQSR